MTLSRDLYDSNITFHCPECKAEVVRKGSWFKSARVYICASCNAKTRLTYGLKLAIFDAHLHPPSASNLPAHVRRKEQ